ncbi:TetR/AcrR family transcriptional regulator [Nocardiopsis tropica]|jgi:AcrR family transcriptional regulator|uniref:TetR/AcrR family transcriptional regulator n=1 Tax=Nocardiopsis tropica TaxID=109330 RepID=A0ABU7L0V3_9ACTN|nr:TetR/AcrR family transcriptional regulator [Nocardiopsis umidischolae]MEE2055143.1 TetR/AcrR family transcriptional regulator [Nocardiopsis umidischolae]
MTSAPNSERRSERARRAILDAAFDLVSRKGFAKVTIEGIAAQAGVGKPTIYRWWSSKGAVVLEAMNEELGDDFAFPDTGDIAADLTTQITAVSQRLVTGRISEAFKGVMAEAQNDAALMKAFRETILEPSIAECRARLDSAVAAGQLRSDVPTDVMVDLFYAPVHYRHFLGFGDDAVRRSADLVQDVLLGLRPRPDAG